MTDLISKYKCGKALCSDEKQMQNLFNSIKEESPEISVGIISSTNAKNTGVELATTFRILKEFKEKGNNSSPSKKRQKLNTVDIFGNSEKPY